MAKKKQKKANNGEGTIRRRENGSFEYRIRYMDVYGVCRRKSFSGQSDTECMERAKRFLARNEKEKKGIDFSLTIPQIARMKADKNFEDNYTKEPTYRRNLETIKVIENSPLGSVPIADVTKKMLEVFLSTLKDYADATIQKIFQVIKGAFCWAKENQLIEIDIIAAGWVRCPRSNKQTKVIRALTVDEQKKLVEYLNNFKPYAYRNVYTIQLMIEMYAGLRMGEINALRYEDIDLKNNVISVHSTVTRGLNYETLLNETTKTQTGTRQVPIMNELLPYIHQALDQYQENKNRLLFYDHVHHKMITTSQVNCFYLRCCEKLGIKSSGQHSLRHTFATRCIESGVEAVVLKNWMGHTNIHVTLDTYADVFASMHNSAIAALGDYIKEVI